MADQSHNARMDRVTQSPQENSKIPKSNLEALMLGVLKVERLSENLTLYED
jgi:hypothetical protein